MVKLWGGVSSILIEGGQAIVYALIDFFIDFYRFLLILLIDFIDFIDFYRFY